MSRGGRCRSSHPPGAPAAPPPAPAPAVLLPSEVTWEGRWWDWTCDQRGLDGEEGKTPDPCEHHDPPSPLRGGGSFTQEQGSLREVRAQLIQKQGDIMGGLGWGGAGDGQSSHDAETADARTVSLSPESRQWMPTSQEAWYK